LLYGIKEKGNIMHSLGQYEEIIQKRYIPTHQCGIELSSIGTKKKIGHFPIHHLVQDIINAQEPILESCFSQISQFGQEDETNKPIWYKINVVDQAFNDYVGIGFLNLQSNWPMFIGALLDVDRADQSGDIIVAIMDRSFKWAARITLSQDTKQLRIDLYQ
jgi:hypothetical protein